MNCIINEKLKRKWNNSKSKYKFIFIMVILWGIFAHGMMIFNKIAFFDDVNFISNISITYTAQLGRWMGAFLMLMERFVLLGFSQFSTSTMYGMIAFFSLTVILCMLSDLFEFDNKYELIAITGFAVTFPTILMLFGYIHFVPYYFPAPIFMCIGCYIICKRRSNIVNFICAVISIACGTGVYQCFFPFAMSILVLYLINEIEKGKFSWFQYWKKIFYYFACGLCSLILYLLINKAVQIFFKIEMTSHAGLDTLGITNLGGYLKRVLWAYRIFLDPLQNVPYGMYPFNVKIIYLTLLVSSVFLVFIEIVQLKKIKTKYAIEYILLVIILPLSVNLLFVMGDISIVHALHMFPQIILYLFVLQRVRYIRWNSEKMEKFIKTILVMLVIITDMIYVRYDNTCYVKADVVLTQTTEWFSTLIYRIESIDGYNDTIPVAYVNEFDKEDQNISDIQNFDSINMIVPYSMNTRQLINSYNWKQLMKVWNGYSPEVVDAQLLNQDIIDAMPSYPDDGSIKIVEGIIVIKF